jgi:S1-C subfamily serine protease
MNDRPIRFECPSCGRRLKARAEMASRTATCACGERVRVPNPVLTRRVLLLGAGAALLILAGLTAVLAVAPAAPRLPPEFAQEPPPTDAPPAPPPASFTPAAPPALPRKVETSEAPPTAPPAPRPGGEEAPKPAPVVAPEAPAPKPPVAKKPAAKPGRDQKAMLEEVKGAVALIQGKYGHGSGFLIRPDVVVTNSHVVLCDMMEDVTVHFATDGVPDDRGIKARLLYEDKGRDLALLWLEKPQSRPMLPLAKDFTPAGRPTAFVVGCPGQLDAGRALTHVAEPAQCEPDPERLGGKPFYRLTYSAAAEDVRIGLGNSGGPAVNDRGEVIGVLTRAAFRSDARPSGRAYCIPVGSVRDALDGLGHPSGWARHADQAAGRHARDIAAISVYGNAIIGAAVVEARYVLRQAGVNDGPVLAAYKQLNKRFAEMARPALAAAHGSSELTREQKQLLSSLQAELNQIRELALLPGVPYRNVLVSQDREKQCQKHFEAFCKDSGMTAEFVRLMVTDILREAGVDVK